MSSQERSAETLVASAYQIEQWKKENPDNIDEMPIQAHDFNRSEIIGREASLARSENQPEQQPVPDDHVQRVQPGHGKVEKEIKLSVIEPSGRQARQNVSFRGPIEARDNVLDEFLMILVLFFADECATENHGQDQKENERAPVADLRGADRQS